MKTVLVIGGGITGLSAMSELNQWKKTHQSEIRLVLVEAKENLGGKIRTVNDHGFVMETGADSIVARKGNIISFINKLGLESEMVYNQTGRSFLFSEGELKPIPEDAVFGIPASIQSLAESTLVSAEGKVAALKDLYTKNETFTKNDSIGHFLEHFLGKEIVTKQIAPVLSGVYSGNLYDLTIASTLPYLLEYKNEYGSIIRGLEANKKKFQSGGEKKFISFSDGLSTFISAMEKELDYTEVIKNVKATNIKKVDDQYKVEFANHDSIQADYIILSLPYEVAQNLLADESLTEEFTQMKNSSLISVYLGFNIPDDRLPLEGTGFIKANNEEDLMCNACTWTSRKWAHTSKTANLLIRMFYKSNLPNFTALSEMSEEQLVQVAREDLVKSVGISTQPLVSEVTKWTNNMPTYQITHPQIVTALEDKLAEQYPGILLAGCSYYGVGIPDCIENGTKTAQTIIEQLSEVGS